MYEMMFYGGLILFLIGVMISVILFVRNDVAKIIGDLTGYNAKRAMKRLKKEKEGKKGSKKNTEEGNKKKRKSILLERIREGRTDVLTDAEDIADRPRGKEKRENAVRSERSGVLQMQKKEVTASEDEKLGKHKKSSEMEKSGIFQMEEDMTVLGGEIVKEMPTTILRDGDLFKVNEPDYDRIQKTAPTSVLKSDRKSLVLQNGISAFDDADEEDTEILGGSDETTEVLGNREEATEVLDITKKGNLDAGEEETEVLQGEEVTNLLAENDVTEVLQEGHR